MQYLVVVVCVYNHHHAEIKCSLLSPYPRSISQNKSIMLSSYMHIGIVDSLLKNNLCHIIVRIF